MSKYYSLILILFSTLLLSACLEDKTINKTEVNQVTEVKAPDYFRKCTQDTDCILIASDCNMCCSKQIINKVYEAEFKEQMNKVCSKASKDEKNLVCNCISMIERTGCNEEGLCIGFNKQN